MIPFPLKHFLEAVLAAAAAAAAGRYLPVPVEAASFSSHKSIGHLALVEWDQYIRQIVCVYSLDVLVAAAAAVVVAVLSDSAFFRFGFAE